MTREELFNAINTNAQVACSALLGLYARQTADEQEAQATGHTNGMGFNGTDAAILSSFAEQVIGNRAKKAAGEGGYPSDLSPRQLELLRKKLVKYGRQLEEIAEEKAAAKLAKAETSPTVGEVQPKEETRLPAVNGFDVPAVNPLTGLPWLEASVVIPGGWRWATDKEMAARTGASTKTGLTPAMLKQLDEFELIITKATDAGLEVRECQTY